MPLEVSGCVVVVGHVADHATAARVVLAAARGAGMIVSAEKGLVDDLDHDFERLRGPRVHDDPLMHTVRTLPVETRNLLLQLAKGDTLNEAAAACHLSERTAFRRVSNARRHVGVATTTELVLAVMRLDRDAQGPV